ncbi:MAG: phenylacetate--CoA ligase family protein, partial [Dehalococcoidia bacterium]|nr:phenylacetate--CoA ligase family protein [Dehalococcoidia bacterium]
FFSGEPGASVPATRRLIEETFGCYIVDQGSMAEMTPWMSNSGCRHLDGGMHLWQDIVYTEMVDPQTKLNLAMGEEGVPVYSHTERTSQPMIRYWSGDIARWDMVDCPCGRTYPTLVTGIYGRVDDMIIVRGQNVFPSRIEDVLRSMDEFGGEFRLVLERETGQMDRLTVQAEVVADAYASQEFKSTELKQIRERFTAELRRAIGVSVAVQLKPAGEFERTQFKARRIIDLRTP